MEDFFYESKTKRVIRNINKTLDNGLIAYKDSDNKRTRLKNKILGIHGLTNDKFDYIAMANKTIRHNINDISIDDNSNKGFKSIETINQEASIPFKKLLGYDYLYRELRKLYGKEEAKRLSYLMYDFTYAMSDSTQILKPYCLSFNASVLLMEGRPFGQLKSSPAKHIESYISSLTETVHQLSSVFAGAIAVPTLFIDCAATLIKDGYNLNSLKDKKVVKSIENSFQRFVFAVNHISRNGIESPFSNISIFQKSRIKSLIEEMNYLFPPCINYDGYVDLVYELQNIFMDFFEKGDILNSGVPYRFPVSTISLSKNENNEVTDENFLDYVCGRQIERYNIFVSEGTKYASCCRLLSDSDMLDIASQSNSFGGGGSVNLGSLRVLTLNFNRIALRYGKKHFIREIKNAVDDIVKILYAHRKLIKRTQDQKLQMFFDLGWINMSRMFSTIGILGYNECLHTLGENKAFLKRAFIAMNDKVIELSKEYEIPLNIEAIPGESMSVRLCECDKLLYGEDKVPFEMYSNQFTPLWEDVGVFERMKTDGMYNKLITGGGITFIQTKEKVTKSQAKMLIKKSIEYNCEHFNINPVWSICENNHVHIGKTKKCVECGENIKDYMTRVVGFMVPVSNWNPKRRDWEFKNRKTIDL